MRVLLCGRFPPDCSPLGVAPLRGRAFADDETVEGRDKVAMISHGLWRDRLTELRMD